MKKTLITFLIISVICVATGNTADNTSERQVNYPIRFGYINRLSAWWPATAIAAGLGVPGYSTHTYNYLALSFWTSNSGPVDVALIWQKPSVYMGTESVFGNTDAAIRTALKKAYNDAGVKILVSAFGSTDEPTRLDPVVVATNLAKFVNDNNLDGADIDYEDNGAMEQGRGEAWLITFTTTLRNLMPNKVITHAPQAPYFKEEYYQKGAYIKVDR